MRMPAAMVALFNDQITLQLHSSHTFRQLAIEMRVQDLPGMAAWLRHQADEEVRHANRLIDHMTDRGERPVIGAVPAPPLEPMPVTPEDVFALALEREHVVSDSIRELYRAAVAQGDVDCLPLLLDSISEQVREEAKLSEVLGRISHADNDGPGLLTIDEALAQRPLKTTEAPPPIPLEC